MVLRRISALAGALLLAVSLTGCGYNDIQAADEAVSAGWSEVTNQYKRRADLIPNLVETVKAFAKQEKEVLLGVTNARAKASQITVDPSNPASLKAFEGAQANMGSALSRLLVTVEQYPQLKSDANFRDLQAQLEGTENRIAVARNRYIDSVRQYNVLIRKFPVNFTAQYFEYEKKPQFTVADRKAIQEAPTLNFDNKK